jgi:hypothetical protein
MIATSRRTALCSLAVTVLAGPFTVPGITADSADAHLIGLCGQLHALHDAFSDLFDRRQTIEEEQATEPEMMALFERQHALLDAIEDAGPPTTMAGATAVARAALALYPDRDAEGTPMAQDDSHWLLLVACEALAENA